MVKDLLVHLDGTRWDDVKLAWAGRIAALFESHVSGLYTNLIPEVVLTAVGGGSEQLISELMEEARAEGTVVADRLKAKRDLTGAPGELIHLDLLRGALRNDLPIAARTADLVVALKPYGADDISDYTTEAVEAFLFGTGRGVFVTPHSLPAEGAGFPHIAIAWKSSREAARAVAEAMPFLRKAKRVTVIIASEDGHPERHGQAPGYDIAAHLDRHGVEVAVSVVRGRGSDIALALLDECAVVKADLLVMGAYSRSRLSEWILGGATRDMLHQASLPVLFAH